METLHEDIDDYLGKPIFGRSSELQFCKCCNISMIRKNMTRHLTSEKHKRNFIQK